MQTQGEPDAGQMIGAILVDSGAAGEALDPKAFMPVIEPFIGRRLEPETTQNLLNAISSAARTRGYVFAKSSIPAQTMTAGVLRVKLDLGRIDRIDLNGVNSSAVQAMLAPLVGKPATRRELERRLMLAGDLPGVVIGRTDFATERGEGVLSVQVSRQSAGLQLGLDNRGTAAVGPVRLTMGYDLSGIIGEDRLSLSGQVQMTPFDLHEMAMVAMRAGLLIGNDGTEIALSGTISKAQPQGRISPFAVTGTVRYAGVAINHPLWRSRKASLWLGGSFDYFAISQSMVGIQVLDERVALLGMSLNGYAPLAGGRVRAGIGVSHALGVLGATAVGDPLSSRLGAGAGATVVSGWANWQGTIAGPFAARLAVSGQMASAALPSVMQMGVGGPQFGRAFEYAERSGDEGVLGSAELQYNAIAQGTGLLRAAQLYGFADTGTVSNLRNSFGSGSLSSAGFGGRFTLPQRVKLGLEMAFPLDAIRYESGDRTPRFSASLGANF